MRKFDKYLEDIGISIPIRNRIYTIVAEYESISTFTVDDIFISEYLNNEGGREMTSLYMLNNNYLMEAKGFIISDNYDWVPIHSRIFYIQIVKQEFDFVMVSEKSKMTINLALVNQVTAALNATGNNCPYLLNLYKRYFLVNINL
jgi:hypothetical protein